MTSKIIAILPALMGAVEREDIIPQLADFCLQFENTERVVVSGKWRDALILSVRKPGYVRSAGEVVRKLFGVVGRGGGHRTMAKAIVPLRHWRKTFGSTRDSAVAREVESLFMQELYGGAGESASDSVGEN